MSGFDMLVEAIQDYHTFEYFQGQVQHSMRNANARVQLVAGDCALDY